MGIDLYLWNNISPENFAGTRYFGDLKRVSLAYGPKAGSVLYFGILMYFYYIKYKHIQEYNKLIIRLGFYTSLLLFLLCQTISGYIILIIAILHQTSIRSTIGYRVVHDYIKIIVIVAGTIITLFLMYFYNLGSSRSIILEVIENILMIIEESLFVGSGYGHILFASNNPFGLNSDYSLFLVILYELGFIPMLVLSSILFMMNKKYIIYYFYFVLSSMAAHSTNNLIFYGFIAIFVNNLIEYSRYKKTELKILSGKIMKV